MFKRMLRNLSGHFQPWDTSRQFAARGYCLSLKGKSFVGIDIKDAEIVSICVARGVVGGAYKRYIPPGFVASKSR